MPTKPARPCKHPRCPNLTREPHGYCAEHAHLKPQPKRKPENRISPSKRGYGRAWKRKRDLFIADYPRCARCGAPAKHVDHILPKTAGGDDSWDNLQSLCLPCHNTKTSADKRRYGGMGG